MIISSSPTRLSLGSMDHSPFAERFGGNALNIAINKRIYILIRKRNNIEDFKYRISYSKTELCNDIDEIEHPLVRESIRYVNVKDPIEVVYSSDVPTQLGMGTSSSMTVALLKALYYFNNTAISSELLFDRAYLIERELVKEQGGFQDFSCTWGGLNYLEGSPYKINRIPVVLSMDKLEELKQHILLLYTGKRENSNDVLKEQLKKMKKGQTLEESLRIKSLVSEMYSLFLQPDFHPMHLCPAIKEGWELKKKLSSTMTSELINNVEHVIYGIDSYAGVRLVGSGGGRGLIMVITKPRNHDEIIRKTKLKSLDFDWDFDGCRVRKVEG